MASLYFPCGRTYGVRAARYCPKTTLMRQITLQLSTQTCPEGPRYRNTITRCINLYQGLMGYLKKNYKRRLSLTCAPTPCPVSDHYYIYFP